MSRDEASCCEPANPAPGRSRGRLATCCSVVGIGGSLVCSFSMVAAAVGLFVAGGAAAAKGTGSSMAGMSGMGSGSSSGAAASHYPGWLDVLIRFGPEFLVVSVLLLTLAVTLRRRTAAVPALVGGVILYVGMYAQPSLSVMYAAMILGTALLLLAYLASLRPTLGRWMPRPVRMRSRPKAN